MNFTSSLTSPSSGGFSNLQTISDATTKGFVQPGQPPDRGSNRKLRREYAKIKPSNTHEAKPARYRNADEKRKLAGRQARRHFAKLEQKAAERQNASSTNASLSIDGADVAEPIAEIGHDSWRARVSHAVSGLWSLMSSTEALKTSDEKAKETKETKELARYADLVAQLRKSGVKKIFLGEGHWDQANTDMIGGATFGASQLKEEQLVLYREMSTDGQDEMYDYVLANTKDRNHLFEILLACIVENPDEAAGPGVNMLRNAITQSARVKIKMMAFDIPNRMDMHDFLKEEDFAMASVGLAHAMFEFNTKYDLRLPWTGLITKSEYPAPLYPVRVQKAMWNGFEKALKICPTALILQSEAWVDQMTKEDVQNYYNKKGLVVVELPLTLKVNATIIAPSSTSILSMLQKFAKKHAGHVWIFCKGIEGCDTPEVEKQTPHDEF